MILCTWTFLTSRSSTGISSKSGASAGYSLSGNRRKSGPLTTVQPQVPQSQPYSHFNPFTPEFRVARDSDQNASSGFQEIHNQQNKMTEMLVQQYQDGLLPSLRITKFTGNPLEYSTFIRSFESQIESKVKPSDVCLRYLEQYLEGEPRELIRGCLHLDGLNG